MIKATRLNSEHEIAVSVFKGGNVEFADQEGWRAYYTEAEFLKIGNGNLERGRQKVVKFMLENGTDGGFGRKPFAS